jgi:hypothetical protein
MWEIADFVSAYRQKTSPGRWQDRFHDSVLFETLFVYHFTSLLSFNGKNHFKIFVLQQILPIPERNWVLAAQSEKSKQMRNFMTLQLLRSSRNLFD